MKIVTVIYDGNIHSELPNVTANKSDKSENPIALVVMLSRGIFANNQVIIEATTYKFGDITQNVMTSI